MCKITHEPFTIHPCSKEFVSVRIDKAVVEALLQGRDTRLKTVNRCVNEILLEMVTGKPEGSNGHD